MRKTVSKESKDNRKDDGGRNVETSGHEATGLEEEHGLFGKSGEGGEATAKTYSEKQ